MNEVVFPWNTALGLFNEVLPDPPGIGQGMCNPIMITGLPPDTEY